MECFKGLLINIRHWLFISPLISQHIQFAAENDAEQEILLCVLETEATDSSPTGKLNDVKRDRKKSHELNFFSFESIVSATNNFAAANKLGEGGFGPVFKVH